MPLIALPDFSDILINLSIEDIESTIFLNFMSSVDILLDGFFILVDFVLDLFLLIDGLFLSGVNFCLDSGCSSFGLGVNELDIWIFPNCSHVVIIIRLKLILQVEELSILFISIEYFLQFTQSYINIFDNIFTFSRVLQEKHFTLEKSKGWIELFLDKHLENF